MTNRTRIRTIGVVVLACLLAAASTVDASVQPGPAFVSDDFDAPNLDPVWSVVDPVGDGSVAVSGAGSGAAHLELAVPAGTSHDPWHTNRSLRVMQPAANGDFVAEVGFASVPTGGTQMQGLIVEQDEGNWLRFEVHHTGSKFRAFAARTVDGSSSSTVTATLPAPPGSGVFLRVARVGDEWTMSWSYDAVTWTVAGSFSHALAVAAVGPFAGNGGTAKPAFTALVDYVFDAAAPVAPEDGVVPVPVDVTVDGSGQVARTPDLPTYTPGQEVTLSAQPDPGWSFEGWSGDLTGAANPASVTATQPVAVTAHFVQDAVPLAISGASAEAGTTGATVTWDTTVPATSTVRYGPTEAYEAGEVTTAELVTGHAVELGDLAPATTYHYAISSVDALGNVASTEDATFTTTSSLPVGTAFASDDFDAPTLNPVWSVVDPVGDGAASVTGAGTGEARLELAVPAGTSHDPWNTNRSLRVMQPAADTDFSAVVDFASVPSVGTQMQGLIVEQDEANWLRFEVHHNGSTLRAFAARTVDGSSSTVLNTALPAPPGSEVYLRVTRAGAEWTLEWSFDGWSWTPAGSFSHDLTVGAVGPFAGNAGGRPAFTALVDYVFDAAAPIVDEDGVDRVAVDVAVDGGGQVVRTPDMAGYEPGLEVTLEALPAPGWTFGSWSGGLTGTENPATLTATEDVAVTAHFVTDETPLEVGEVSAAAGPTTASVNWSTNKPATARVAYGPTAAYEAGEVVSDELATDHALELGGLVPETTYHYAVTSVDVLGNEVSSEDGTFTTSAMLPAGSAFVSDDFHAPAVDPVWSVVDPKGDGTVSVDGAGSGESRLSLAVPEGSAHDPWNTNRSLRMMQPAADVDFQAELGFASVPSAAYQSQGLIVEQDEDDWLRFEVHHNGSSLRAFAAKTTAGFSTGTINRTIPTPPDQLIFLRVGRAGTQWTLSYSYDGEAWSVAGTFDHTQAVSAVGPFVGNNPSGGAPAPAYEALVDYVFDSSAPIVAEDGVARHTLALDTVGDGTVSRSPVRALYPAGSTVTLTAEPAPGWIFDSWSGGATGSDNPATVTMDGDRAVTAQFAIDPAPPEIRGVSVTAATSSAVLTWRTSKPATTQVSHGTTESLELGTVQDDALVMDHQLELTGLAPETTYHYAIGATDGLGQTTATAVATFTTASEAAPLIAVWYGDHQVFGALGQPSQWNSVLGNVSDIDGIDSLTYSLNGGAPMSLRLGPDLRRLASPGDFNIELPYTDYAEGLNEVVLTATDTRGNVATRTVTVERQVGNTWPLPYDTDWASAGHISDRAQLVDGEWVLEGDTVRPTVLDYDRLIALGDLSWTDYEVEMPLTVHALGTEWGTPQSGDPLVGFTLRWQGHAQRRDELPRVGLYPTGAYAWYRYAGDNPAAGKYELIGNNHWPIVRDTGAPLPLDVPMVFKARVETLETGSRYSFKFWPQAEAEPAGWNLQMVDEDTPSSGAIAWFAHHADVSFGDVTVTPLAPPPDGPPQAGGAVDPAVAAVGLVPLMAIHRRRRTWLGPQGEGDLV